MNKLSLFIFTLLFSFNLFAISQAGLDQAMDDVDGWCMDTYCAGDFNYYNPSLTYNEQTKRYQIIFKAEDWYQGEILQEVIDSKKSFPVISNYESDWTDITLSETNLITIESVKMEGSYWEEYGLQPVATFSCQFELVDKEMNESDFFKNLYDITLDCVGAFEMNL